MRKVVLFLIGCVLVNASASALDAIVTVWGTGTAGYAGDNGPADAAQFNTPIWITSDPSGNYIVSDYNNHAIRKINKTTGIITTIAGNGTSGYSGDTLAATGAQLNHPVGTCYDAAGNLYIADQSNNRIRKVDTSGNITSVAGNGTRASSPDGTVAFNNPIDTPAVVSVDANGVLYFGELNSNRIRSLNLSTGILGTFAGTGTAGYSGDNGPAASAQVSAPGGALLKSDGSKLIVDSGNNVVRTVSPTGTISTIAGTGSAGFFGDGGAATSATFRFTSGSSIGGTAAYDSKGNLFIADAFNYRIRKVDQNNVITTVAGNGMSGYAPGIQSALDTPLGGPGGFLPETQGLLFVEADNHVIRRLVFSTDMNLPLGLSSVKPARGGNSGEVTVTINGTGFKDNSTVKLVRSGQTDIPGTFVRNLFGLALNATFDLNGQPVGAYDVVVTNPDATTKTLAGAFTVEVPGAGKLTVDIISRDFIRGGVPMTISAVCRNAGNTDALLVPLVVAVPKDMDLALTRDVIPIPAFDGIPKNLDYSQVKKIAQSKTNNVAALLLPVVPANGSVAINFRVKVPDTFGLAHIKLPVEAFVMNSIYPSASGKSLGALTRDDQTTKCILDLAQIGLDLAGIAAPEFGIPLGLFNTFVSAARASYDKGSAFSLNDAALAFSGYGAGLFGDENVFDDLGKQAKFLGIGLNLFDAYKAGVNAVDDCKQFFPAPLKQIEAIVSGDPNDKSGPAGPGTAHYIPRGKDLAYLIQFENKPDVTAAAQTVVVTDVLDSNTMDVSKMTLGPITVAGRVINVPDGVQSFQAFEDFRPAKELILRVVARLDGNRITWTFETLDPTTKLPTEDSVLGFLNPNKTPPEGEGSVMFIVPQKANLAFGTEIKNQARIVFDANAPIDTPVWTNTLGQLGSDTDGDFFPDELETAAGTDPNSAASTPLGAGVFTPQPLRINKLALRLDFSDKQKDGLQMSGLLPILPDGFVFDGKTFAVYFGGVYKSFTLDEKGSSSQDKAAKCAIKNSKTGALFTVKIAEPMSSKFADEGLDAADDVKKPKSVNRQATAIVLFNGALYQTDVRLVFSAKKGKSGSASLLAK